MSTEVTVLLDNLPILAGDLDEDTLAVAGSGVSSKRISIKGGVFRKIVGGKEVGNIQDRHMNIIFVKMAHSASRTYYNQAFKEGEKISPVCWSTDSKKPDEGVKTPQSPTCDSCGWSVKGTGQDGKGTACRLSWRTAVVLPNDPAGDVMQLVIPAASVFGDEESGRWPFRSYIQMIASRGISAGRVITKMSFDTKAASPKVLFNPVGAVPAEDLATIKQQGASIAAENAVKMTVYHRDEEGAVEVAIPTEAMKVFDEVKAIEESETAAEPAKPAEPEPTLRETTVAAAPEKDVSAVIAKWASKK